MMTFIVSLVLLSGANVDDLLTAKKSTQILNWHRREEEVAILKQRCEAEVRASYFPTNCFLWQEKARLPPNERRFFQNWFESVCVKSLREDSTQARFHLSAIGKLHGACRDQLIRSAQNWLYRVKKEGETDVFRRLKVGNEIEMLLEHETLEKKQPQRSQAPGTIRRRLN
jgi:hypothetical protein